MRRIHITITAAVTLLVAALIVILYYTRWRKVNPVEGRISSKFGPRNAPLPGASTNHNGVDVAVPTGTKVRAPWAGKVKSVYSNSLGGKQMIIEHYNGYRTGYAHLSEYRKQEGNRVLAGEVIALSGNTGNSTGPHLHFTLTDKQGNKIDPETMFNF